MDGRQYLSSSRWRWDVYGQSARTSNACSNNFCNRQCTNTMNVQQLVAQYGNKPSTGSTTTQNTSQQSQPMTVAQLVAQYGNNGTYKPPASTGTLASTMFPSPMGKNGS